MNMLRARIGPWLIVAAALLVGGQAMAEVKYSLNLKWGVRKGILVQVPQLGNTACLNHVIGLNAPGIFGTPSPPPFGNNTPFAFPTSAPLIQAPANPGKPFPPFNNLNGCVGGSSVASSTMAAGGATITMPRTANGGIAGGGAIFTVPPNFVSIPPPVARNITPVPNVPGVVQFGSRAGVYGPPATPITPLKGSPASHAQFRRFKADAWMTQTGRPGLDFTNCWFGGTSLNPLKVQACTNVNQVGGGLSARPLIVKYKSSAAGKNFGGTLSLLYNQDPPASPTTLVISQTPYGYLPSGAILVQNNPGFGTAIGGRGYAATQTVSDTTRMAYLAFTSMIQPTGTPTSTMFGTIVGNFAGTIPGFTATGTLAFLDNMPLTVGTVLARNTGTRGGNPLTVTLTARGYDSRTQWGQGRIQLVTGGFVASAGNTPNIEVVTMDFAAVPEPGAAMLLVAGGLYLVGIHRLRRLRR